MKAKLRYCLVQISYLLFKRQEYLTFSNLNYLSLCCAYAIFNLCIGRLHICSYGNGVECHF